MNVSESTLQITGVEEYLYRRARCRQKHKILHRSFREDDLELQQHWALAYSARLLFAHRHQPWLTNGRPATTDAGHTLTSGCGVQSWEMRAGCTGSCSLSTATGRYDSQAVTSGRARHPEILSGHTLSISVIEKAGPSHYCILRQVASSHRQTGLAPISSFPVGKQMPIK
ncbi:hypothetical protein PoB_005188000 [Plakobranchus ocellatus]|uniref:Uncharacterized protein n=1 Tax=Plakobranchus ocellatus TaxID=259542 RepID=A0AAV4BY81_9GAST|nr:hypothetical protein PoB_005188000 [Plakobranchus ocellatus]